MFKDTTIEEYERYLSMAAFFVFESVYSIHR